MVALKVGVCNYKHVPTLMDDRQYPHDRFYVTIDNIHVTISM